MQKVCHSPEGGGGPKNCHFGVTNEPFVILLEGGGGMKFRLFGVTDILFAWPHLSLVRVNPLCSFFFINFAAGIVLSLNSEYSRGCKNKIRYGRSACSCGS